MGGKSVESLKEYLTRQRLLDSASEGSQSPERTSRSSLIAIPREDRYICQGWFPLFITLLFLLLVSCCIFFLLFSFSRLREQHRTECEATDPYATLLVEDRNRLDDISQKLLNSFDPARIRKNLRWLSKNNHIAGTVENSVLMMKLADEYHSLGFHVKTHNYSVLLNYPDFEKPNTVEVQDESGSWWVVSEGRGRPLGPTEAQAEQSDHRSQIWWNAYSPNATVEGPLVYCNYGMKEDFDHLAEIGENIKGAIVLIRYGGIGRAEKVREAEKRGAVGVILFSDPQLFASGGDRNKTFPNDISLPGEDAQRGSVFGSQGDPLTPLFPSLNYVHRSESVETVTEKGYLPRIPVTPIGYHDASYLFANLDGDSISDTHWKGAVNSVYRRTGSRRFRLRVRSRMARKTITNVIARLPGKEEPDQWVLVGNHVDAWGNGAIDPLTGTATQLEMAKVAAKVFSNSPPRRSLVFCHWDAEEFGLIGSTEWIEEMQFVLGSRAVVYVNVDHIAGNTTLDVKATPSLFRLLADSAERIPQPNKLERKAGRATLLDSWRFHRGKGPIPGDRTIPDIGLPAGGSDYQRFVNFLGVPSADIKMETTVGHSYGLYHTMYETFWTVQRLGDPHFSSMTAVGQFWMEVAHRLANELVLPLNSRHIAQSLQSMVHKIDAHMAYAHVSNTFPAYRDKMDRLKEAIRRFHLASRAFNLEIQEIASGDIPISLSRLTQINSRLQQMERVFIDPLAFPSSLNRHLLFSPNNNSQIAQIAFIPGLTDPLSEFIQTSDSGSLERLNDGFTRLQYAIESAIHVLSF